MISLRRQFGFSLVELAVAIVIVGLVIGGTARLMTQVSDNSSVSQQASEELVREIDLAVRGFVMANHRLPCPDLQATRDGLEDCTTDDEEATGFLPLQTLGVFPRRDFAWMRDIVYGVSRSGANFNLSSLDQEYTQIVSSHTIPCENAVVPDPLSNGTWCDVDDTTADFPAVTTTDLDFATASTALNVLDLCVQLETASQAAPDDTILHSEGPPDAGGDRPVVNVAYAYALPGSSVVSAGGGYIESGARLLADGPDDDDLIDKYIPPQISDVIEAGNNDRIQLRSFASLYQDLDCPFRLSSVETSYYGGYANVSSEYLARMHLAIAKIQLSNAEGDVSSAERELLFNAIGIALAGADLAVSIAEATTLNAAAVAAIALATAELANAIAGTVLAQQGLSSAEAWRDEVETETAGFRLRLTEAGNALATSREVALDSETRGGL